jgi:colicin import membrane protein
LAYCINCHAHALLELLTGYLPAENRVQLRGSNQKIYLLLSKNLSLLDSADPRAVAAAVAAQNLPTPKATPAKKGPASSKKAPKSEVEDWRKKQSQWIPVPASAPSAVAKDDEERRGAPRLERTNSEYYEHLEQKKLQAAEEAKLKAAEEAKLKAAEEAKLQAAEEAKLKAAEEAKLQANQPEPEAQAAPVASDTKAETNAAQTPADVSSAEPALTAEKAVEKVQPTSEKAAEPAADPAAAPAPMELAAVTEQVNL